MPPRNPTASRDLKARIPVLRFEFGLSVKEICKILGIRKSLVYKSLHYHCIYGTTTNPNARSRSGPRKLTQTDLAFIRDMIAQRHTLYLDEIQQELVARRGILVSIPTLTRTLRRLDFSHKKISARAIERNELMRAAFMNKIGTEVLDPAMLMFTDETAKDERTSSRRLGWSKIGTRCVQRRCFVRGQRYSILPVLTLDGLITWDIIEGSVTSERFVQFLREHVVRICTHIFLISQLTVHLWIDTPHKPLPGSS
jgi:transposase